MRSLHFAPAALAARDDIPDLSRLDCDLTSTGPVSEWHAQIEAEDVNVFPTPKGARQDRRRTIALFLHTSTTQKRSPWPSVLGKTDRIALRGHRVPHEVRFQQLLHLLEKDHRKYPAAPAKFPSFKAGQRQQFFCPDKEVGRLHAAKLSTCHSASFHNGADREGKARQFFEDRFLDRQMTAATIITQTQKFESVWGLSWQKHLDLHLCS